VVGAAPSFTTTPEYVTKSPTSRGAARVASGPTWRAGSGNVWIVTNRPLASFGRLDWGQRGSLPAAGSIRGMQRGNPVTVRTVGFSASTVNRTSGELARPKRPRGSLTATRWPVDGSPITPPTRSSPVA
jgi:hypothetical protein